MDQRYIGASCPICKKEFTENDDIVVCPDCGAPYHRSCIHTVGGCILEDLHREHKSWEPPKKRAEREDPFFNDPPNRCKNCGTVNPPGSLFCEICGSPLHSPEDVSSRTPDSSGFPPFSGRNEKQPPEDYLRYGYNPFTTPFGGLDAEEEIEEVPVKELAIYVKENTHYFLPRFKTISHRQKNLPINWCGFLLGYYYLLYRKLWVAAAVVFVLSTLLGLPSLLFSLDSVFYSLTNGVSLLETLNLDEYKLIQLVNFCSFLSILLRVALGFFTNKMYMSKTLKNIKQIKGTYAGDVTAYHTALAQKGGTSKVAVIVAVCATILVSSVGSALTLNWLVSLI